MITFENIRKSFDGQEVIKGINFTINEGELVAIIGLSGSGKTTTLKMINRLIEPSSGAIKINGKNILDENLIKLRRNMGYVIQSTGLFPHMTIRDNIQIIARQEAIDEKEIDEKTNELMDLVGLERDMLDRYPGELSGGQQQRVGFARAFLLDPEIVLMDEPFSALDPITRTALQDELLHIQEEIKKTIVFVTHDMSEAIKMADRICIMDQGHIVQYDTPENILKNPANEFVSDFVGQDRIWESPELIKAKDIMFRNVVTGMPDLTVQKAFRNMRMSKVNSLIIVERKTNKAVGILKPKIVNKLKDRSIPVRDVMITDFAWAKPEDSIVDLLAVIQNEEISEIPILDEDMRLLGLVTMNSLITTLSEQYLDENEEDDTNGIH